MDMSDGSSFLPEILGELREAIGPQALARLLADLPSEIQQQRRVLLAAWAEGGLEQMRIAANALKDCVSMLGAMPLSDVCMALEGAAKAHDTARVGELMEAFEAAAAACVAESFAHSSAERQAACFNVDAIEHFVRDTTRD